MNFFMPLTYIQVLHSVALLQICDGLVGEAMKDEPALTLTSMVLHHLNRQEDALTVHVKALELNPNNIVLLRATFGAYVK